MPDPELRVLSLVSYKIFPPHMGGQKCIAFFNRYFTKHAALTCVTTRNNTQFEGEGYEILPLLSNSKWRYANPLLFFKLRRIIRRKKITHLLMAHPYYGWLAVLLKWFCGVNLVIHSLNIEALRFKSIGKWWWKLLWAYEKFTHRRADASFFITAEDLEIALNKFRLEPRRCAIISYGFELTQPPTAHERAAARKTIEAAHNLGQQDTLLLFNGTLDYLPNQKALDVILETINPVLASTSGFQYKIIICGKNLPAVYDDLKSHAAANIVYAGFVNDIGLYFKAADILINPVIEGGGIKTKLVEALGYNLNVVTAKSGGAGVAENVTGGKMQVVADGDWTAFTTAILQADTRRDIPDTFFEQFYWGNLAAKAAALIHDTTKKTSASGAENQ